jgi:predicted GIY-YIG superfamily endonuclease
MSTSPNHDSIVYIVGNATTATRCRYTYVGVTNNLRRRLSQHMGRGGARYTRRSSHWSPMIVIGGLPSRRAALQLEWALKRASRGGRGRTTSALNRRIVALWTVLSRTRGWTSNSPSTESLATSLWVWWHPSLVEVAACQDWVALPAGTQPVYSVESLWELLLSNQDDGDNNEQALA